MNYNDVVTMSDAYLLPFISELYGLEGYKTRLVQAHDGGRNVVYTCEKDGAGAKILRIAFLHDRSREDFLGEVEYIKDGVYSSRNRIDRPPRRRYSEENQKHNLRRPTCSGVRP